MKNTTGYDYPKAINGSRPLMDKIEINQNIFLQINDQNSDLTILPISINWEFLAKLRTSYKMLYGATWNLKAEHIANTFEIKECQHVKRQFSSDFDPLAHNEQNEDNFDEDDFDNDEKESGLKIAGIAGVVCSQIESIQKAASTVYQ
jgi:hypothetical protein